VSSDELRSWIRSADDKSFRDHIIDFTNNSPRTRVRDLHGPIGAARDRCPVQPGSQSEIAGFADYRTMQVFSDRNQFSLLGFAEVRNGFGDADVYSSSIHNETIGQVWGETLLGMDGEQHRHYRDLIAYAFRRKALEPLREKVVEPIVDGLIDRFAGLGRADLVSDLTLLFPVYVIAELLGLPRRDVAQFTAWAVDTILIFHDPVKALAASKLLADYIASQITERRRNPGEDMISQLIAAEVDGQHLSDQEIINFVRILLPAGAETTSRSTSNLLFALMTQPDQWADLRNNQELIDAAIEEGLRWEPPLTSLNRVAVADSELAGVRIPPRSIVACNISAANRDPSRWDRPDLFDIRRPQHAHVAFAHGPHTCLGMHLARMETRVVVEKLLRRIPDIELDTTEQAPEIRGIGVRSPLTLPVAFTPEGGDHQIRASDWTDADLLTLDDALNRLKSELEDALGEIATLRADDAGEDTISPAEQRISAMRARIAHLGTRNRPTAPTQPTGGI
jgi:cytochrome P450